MEGRGGKGEGRKWEEDEWEEGARGGKKRGSGTPTFGEKGTPVLLIVTNLFVDDYKYSELLAIVHCIVEHQSIFFNYSLSEPKMFATIPTQ